MYWQQHDGTHPKLRALESSFSSAMTAAMRTDPGKWVCVTFGVGRNVEKRLQAEFSPLPWPTRLRIHFDGSVNRRGALGDPRLAEHCLKTLLSVAAETCGVGAFAEAHRILAEAGFMSARCPAFNEEGLVSETMMIHSDVLELIARSSTLAVDDAGALVCPFWAAVCTMPYGHTAAATGGGRRATMRQHRFNTVEAVATRVRAAISVLRRVESQLG
jgi:hypothetical protein